MAERNGPIIQRYEKNPILTKHDVPYPVETVHNVVFCCGAVAEDDGTVKIYWGGADSVMCVGTASIADWVDLCLSNPRPALGSSEVLTWRASIKTALKM